MNQLKLLLLALLFFQFHEENAFAQSQDSTDQIIVKFQDKVRSERSFKTRKSQLISELKNKFGLNFKELPMKTFGEAEVWKFERKFDISFVEDFAKEISRNPMVDYSEPDRIVSASFTPNDPYFWEQSLSAFGMESAWDQSSGAGVKIGVVDSGYLPHADLNANYSLNADGTIEGYNFANPSGTGSANPLDTGNTIGGNSWHGAKVSGVIAAVTNNSLGIAGIAHSSKIVPVKVFDQSGNGYLSAIANGIKWARGSSRNKRSRIINLSLSSVSPAACPTTLQSAIDYAAGYSLIIVAAGNSNANAANYFPANCNKVITVGAIWSFNYPERASFSNYGLPVKFVAGGVSVLTTSNTGWTTVPGADDYNYFNGTSFSAPQVSGIAALIISKYPYFDNSMIIRRLVETGTVATGFNPSPFTTHPILVNPAEALNPQHLFAYVHNGGNYTITHVGSTPTVLDLPVTVGVPAGVPPYSYTWSVNDSTLNVTYPTPDKAVYSKTFVCQSGSPYGLETTGQVVVTDSVGRTSTQPFVISVDACFMGGGGVKK